MRDGEHVMTGHEVERYHYPKFGGGGSVVLACTCGWSKTYPYSRPAEASRLLMAAAERAAAHERDSG